MNEFDDYPPQNEFETPRPVNPPALSQLMPREHDAEDAETRALNLLQNLNGATAKIFVTREADGGNLKHEFSAFSTLEKSCESYIWTGDYDFENLYSYVRENYNGGIYRFQIRVGQRNGSTWKKTLADLPNKQPVIEEKTATADAPAPQPAPQPKPINPVDLIIRQAEDAQRLKAALFPDLAVAPARAVAAPVDAETSLLLRLLEKSGSENLENRIIDKLLPSDKNEADDDSLIGLVKFAAKNPDETQTFVTTVVAPVLAPLANAFAPLINRLFGETPAASATSPTTGEVKNPFDVFKKPAPQTAAPPASPPAQETPQTNEEETEPETPTKTKRVKRNLPANTGNTGH